MRTDYETIRVDVDGGVVTVTLNRPDQRNAVTLQMEKELGEAMWAAERDDSVARDRRHGRRPRRSAAGST